jgi:HSP20 family protein
MGKMKNSIRLTDEPAPKWAIKIQREMEWLIDGAGSRKPPSMRFSPHTWLPSIDVYETDKKVVVLAEIAGVKLEEINVLFERNILTIKGDRKDTKQGIRRTYYQMEILWGPFECEVTLPTTVNAEQIEASYENGILEIILPKQKE